MSKMIDNESFHCYGNISKICAIPQTAETSWRKEQHIWHRDVTVLLMIVDIPNNFHNAWFLRTREGSLPLLDRCFAMPVTTYQKPLKAGKTTTTLLFSLSQSRTISLLLAT